MFEKVSKRPSTERDIQESHRTVCNQCSGLPPEFKGIEKFNSEAFEDEEGYTPKFVFSSSLKEIF